jgi:ABC-type multidrug transport system ATPase subunit
LQVLSLRDIHKSYGPVQALNGVSFDVPEGAVFGILGPNGSGKTTLLGIVLDVLKADTGGYRWMDGMAPEAARRQIGALLETPNFYHYLNADENLRINAAIKGRGVEDRDRVLELVGLTSRRGSKFSTYSLGMKQRLAIGSALLGRPRVLVLDEPTNGLDPAGIAEIRTLIRALSAEGITVIMASHLLDEVEKVCTHMTILKRGNVLITGSVKEVMRSEDEIEIAAADMAALQAALNGMANIKSARTENTFSITATDGITPVYINETCAAKGIVLSHLVLKQKSLERTFMELTGGDTA